MSRYIGFIQSLRRNERNVVNYLLSKVQNDLETNTGRNIRFILNAAEEENIFAIDKKKFLYDHKFAASFC